MIKEAVLHEFWSSFGLDAYDENSAPPDMKQPYITYDVVTGNLGDECAMSASIWYRDTSWSAITEKLHEIERYLTRGGKCFSCDGGRVWIKRASPFAQRVGDAEDKMIRRILINISVEFLTEI